MSPQNSVMVMVMVMLIMISSLVVMSVNLKECYKIWVDECKFGLLKEICNFTNDYPRGICCFLLQDTAYWECYFAIADDLKNNYPCQYPDVASGRASSVFTHCQS